jgi:hypothetical protein
MSASYLSPKTVIRRSPIEGWGLFARRPIRQGEIVAIKGRHILDRRALASVRSRIAHSYIQIADGFFIGAATAVEVRRNKLFINHSCAPNLGILGQIIFVARRRIRAGEELTFWSDAVAAAGGPEARPSAAVLVLPALNAMIDITTARTAASREHPPAIIFILLLALALGCSLLAGYSMAGSPSRSWLHVLGFAAILATTVYVILDLEHPRLGLIRVSAADQLLVELRHTMR